MELIIGRDHSTNRLKVTYGNQFKVFTKMPEMEKDISEKHCRITQINEDEFVVTAMKGVTTVNGLDVVTKQIKLTDEIKLGNSGYVLPLSQVLEGILSGVEVMPLDPPVYQKKRPKSKTPVLRMIVTALVILSGILSSIIGPTHPVVFIIGVFAFCMIIYAIYDACKDKNSRN